MREKPIIKNDAMEILEEVKKKEKGKKRDHLEK